MFLRESAAGSLAAFLLRSIYDQAASPITEFDSSMTYSGKVKNYCNDQLFDQGRTFLSNRELPNTGSPLHIRPSMSSLPLQYSRHLSKLSTCLNFRRISPLPQPHGSFAPRAFSSSRTSMAPAGLAILLGAGPTTGSGIARILASPHHGNLAVALLSRSGDQDLADGIAKTSEGGVLKAFKSDTTRQSLESAFKDVKSWSDSLGSDMKLKIAIWNVKHSHKTPFLEEDTQKFGDSLQTYVTGAMNFSQLGLQWMMSQYPEWHEDELPLHKRGTIIFTGTLGALRANTGFGAYGAGRAGVRMLAQSLAREFSAKGVQVVHAIAKRRHHR